MLIWILIRTLTSQFLTKPTVCGRLTKRRPRWCQPCPSPRRQPHRKTRRWQQSRPEGAGVEAERPTEEAGPEEAAKITEAAKTETEVARTEVRPPSPTGVPATQTTPHQGPADYIGNLGRPLGRVLTGIIAHGETTSPQDQDIIEISVLQKSPNESLTSLTRT